MRSMLWGEDELKGGCCGCTRVRKRADLSGSIVSKRPRRSLTKVVEQREQEIHSKVEVQGQGRVVKKENFSGRSRWPGGEGRNGTTQLKGLEKREGGLFVCLFICLFVCLLACFASRSECCNVLWRDGSHKSALGIPQLVTCSETLWTAKRYVFINQGILCSLCKAVTTFNPPSFFLFLGTFIVSCLLFLR